MKEFNYKLVEEAYERIRDYVHFTPLEESLYLSDNEHKVFFKLESMQSLKSFKIRGAMNKMLSLTEEEKELGVGCVSSGNHGASVSYGASLLGIKNCTVICSKATPKAKTQKMKYFGANVIQEGENFDGAHAFGMEYLKSHKMTYIDSYYNDPLVYAGQGTIAIEIFKQNPDIDTIVVPIGGGSLITGISVMAKHIKPSVRIIGVQTAACPAMIASYKDHKFYEEYPTEGDTVCDALVGGVGELSYNLLKDYVDDLIEVSEVSIRKAIKHMIREEKYMIEGGSATTVAALHDYKERIGGKNIALIISGGNIDGELMTSILNEQFDDEY